MRKLLSVFTLILIAASAPLAGPERSQADPLVFAQALSAPPPPPPPPPPPAPPAPQAYAFAYNWGGSWLGVRLEDITAENMGRYNLSEPVGVAIVEVERESPAEEAGLQPGDVILEYAGIPVFSAAQLTRLVRETPAGKELPITISRGGARQPLRVKVGERPRPEFRWPEVRVRVPDVWQFGRRGRLGVQVQELTEQMGEFLGVPEKRGLLVMSVTSGSPAERAGLRAGDVIVAADGRIVEDTNDLNRVLARKRGDEQVELEIVRNKQKQKVTVQLESEERRRESRRGVRL